MTNTEQIERLIEAATKIIDTYDSSLSSQVWDEFMERIAENISELRRALNAIQKGETHVGNEDSKDIPA